MRRAWIATLLLTGCSGSGAPADMAANPSVDFATASSGDMASCIPRCAGRQCGPDPVCGQSCGACATGSCNGAGQCVTGCSPDCSGRQCGPDPLCARSCGVCATGSCNAAGQCVTACIPDCSGRQCGPDPVCGQSCGTCATGTCNGSGQCTTPCVPDCTGLQCGADPVCGQSCGACSGTLQCSAGQCVAPDTYATVTVDGALIEMDPLLPTYTPTANATSWEVDYARPNGLAIGVSFNTPPPQPGMVSCIKPASSPWEGFAIVQGANTTLGGVDWGPVPISMSSPSCGQLPVAITNANFQVSEFWVRVDSVQPPPNVELQGAAHLRADGLAATPAAGHSLVVDALFHVCGTQGIGAMLGPCP